MSGIMGMLLGAKTAIAAAFDEFFNQVTLLLPGDGTNGAQNNTFLDSSSNNFTITRNGNTTQGTFSPFSQTGWSNYASATSGSVGFSNSAAALVSSTTSTFTAECWIYMTEAPVSGDGIPALIGMDATFNSSIYLGFGPNASRNLVLRWFDGASKTATGGTALALNTWYHIAVVANSNALAMYVNGVAETLSGTTTLTNRNGTTNNFSLFMNSSSSNYQFRGYASNIRVCTSAVYTGAFTPSTSPLTTTSQGATNCKLLTAQDNRFIDNSTNAYTLTLQSTPSVQAFSPFAPTAEYSAATVGGSGYFDGTGDYLSIANNTALQLSTSVSWCLEAWIYPTALVNADNGIIGKRTTASVEWQFAVKGTGDAAARELYLYNGSGNYFSGTKISGVNAWHHVAVSWDQTTLRFFINGTLCATTHTSISLPAASTNSVGVGANGNVETFTGYITDARIVKGSAVYTASFTPPTAPLTAITNTSLLTNFTNAGITDATAKNDLETVGNAQISTTQSKFGGSSMYFDGTGDYLKVPSSPNLALGTGDFTVEFWAYPTTFVNYSQWVSTRVADDASYWGIDSNSSGVFYFFTNGIVVQSSAQSTNTWVHIAAVRSGTTFKLYINGVSAGSATLTNNFLIANGLGVGAGANGAQTAYGYIDDVRITKGYARYTDNFTPPTAAFALQ